MTNQSISQVEDVITLICSSTDHQTARAALMADGFGFTGVQANHILDTQLVGLLAGVANPWLDLAGDLQINV